MLHPCAMLRTNQRRLQAPRKRFSRQMISPTEGAAAMGRMDIYIYMPALRQRQLPGGTNLKDSFSLSDFVVAVLLYFILFALLAHCYSFYSSVALLAEFFLFQIPAYLHCKNFLIIITIIFFINILPYYPIKI